MGGWSGGENEEGFSLFLIETGGHGDCNVRLPERCAPTSPKLSLEKGLRQFRPVVEKPQEWYTDGRI